MKFFGAAVVMAYAAMAFSGYEPFSSTERGAVPAEAKRGPGGVLIWYGGFRGGK